MAEKDIDKTKGLPPPPPEIKVAPEIEEHPEEPKSLLKVLLFPYCLQ